MYSGEYDVCDVTLSVSTPGKLKSGHGGNWTHDLWPLFSSDTLTLDQQRMTSGENSLESKFFVCLHGDKI
jgi:hypothetical protein